MSSISSLLIKASFAQASYATIPSIDRETLINRLQTESGGFTPTQAARFADKYSLVTQYNDDAVAGTGNATSFSVAVFKDISTNKLTVALKGTLEGGDYVPTDTNIFINGAGYDQIIAMQNWWRRESAVQDTLVRQFKLEATTTTAAPPVGGIAVSQGAGVIYYLVESQSVMATGNLATAITASANTVDVTGHSLGGHLAMAFQSLNDAATATVTTFNAPGFTSSTTNQQFFTALGGTFPAGAKTTNVIADGVRADDVSFRAIAGLHSRPGIAINVRIENQVPAGEPAKPSARNHSMTILTDAIAVAETFSKVDSSFTLNNFSALFDGASNQEFTSLEQLAGKLRNLIRGANPDQPNLPAGNSEREKLYAALGQVQDDLLVLTNAGPQPLRRIRDLAQFAPASIAANANNGAEALAYRYALKELNPFAIVGDDSLYARHNTNGELKLFDPDSTSANNGQLTEQYFKDRAAMLNALTTRNILDAADSTPIGQASATYRYTQFRDDRLDTRVRVGVDGRDETNRQQVWFGSNASDTLNGGLIGGVKDDRIYGMAGTDQLTGNQGKDYLEGGTGFDTYTFNNGDGQDTILDTDNRGQLSLGQRTTYNAIRTTDPTDKTGYLWVDKHAGIRFTFKPISEGANKGELILTRFDAPANSAANIPPNPNLLAKGDSITINNINLAQATDTGIDGGVLGIKLDNNKRIHISHGVNDRSSANNVPLNPFNLPLNSTEILALAAINTAANLKENAGTVINLATNFVTNQISKFRLFLTEGLNTQGVNSEAAFMLVNGAEEIKFANGYVDIEIPAGQSQKYFQFISIGDLDSDISGGLRVALLDANGVVATNEDGTEIASTLNFDDSPIGVCLRAKEAGIARPDCTLPSQSLNHVYQYASNDALIVEAA
jgi:hypothetical protein